MNSIRSSLVLLVLLLVAAATAASSQTEDRSILERSGQAGVFKLGDKIKAQQDLKEIGDALYSAANGDVILVSDGRSIAEIRVLSRQYFTQKLIRPQVSTLGDVLKVYGDPERTCSSDGFFVASFGQVEFRTSYELTGPLRKADLENLLASQVEVVSLREPGDFKLTFEEGFQQYEQGNWEGLAASMERTICDQPEGEAPQKIRTYGMKFRDYVPHFYLGLAWQNLDRCRAALAAWDKSEKTEGIQDLGSKYGQLVEGRRICNERIDTAGP